MLNVLLVMLVCETTLDPTPAMYAAPPTAALQLQESVST